MKIQELICCFYPNSGLSDIPDLSHQNGQQIDSPVECTTLLSEKLDLKFTIRVEVSEHQWELQKRKKKEKKQKKEKKEKFSTFGPYRLMNHSEVLELEDSNMVFSSPKRPMIFAIMSVLITSAYLHKSSASIMTISAPASKHLSALLISKSTSSTISAPQ